MTRESQRQRETAVIILGGDMVVGQALELLLRSDDYNAKFLPDLSLLEGSELLDRAGLLLLAPGLDPARREAALETVRQGTTPKDVPVLELATDAATTQLAEAHLVVSWPCQTEYLQRQIKSLLLASDEKERGYREERT